MRLYNVQAWLIFTGQTTTQLAGLRRRVIWPWNALARFQSVCKAYTTGALLRNEKKKKKKKTREG